MPAVLEHGGGREVLRVAFLCAGLRPSVNGVDVLRGKTGIVHELTDMRISMPRWHDALNHGLTNGGSPGARVVVSHQRHGRDVIRVMTYDAVLVKNRRYVFVERNRFVNWCVLTFKGQSCRERAEGKEVKLSHVDDQQQTEKKADLGY